MTTAGVNSLSPQQAAERAERWFGARVDYRTAGKIKIYPKDPGQPMIVISDRWSNGHDRLNAVKRLQRAGLDVLNGQTPSDSVIKADGRSIDPHLTKKIEIPEKEPTVTTSMNGTPTPATMPARPAKPSTSDYETVLGMLAEAEGHIAKLTERVTRLERLEHENRARYAAQTKLIKHLGERVEATAVLDPAAQAERERAELTDKAIELLESLPSAATMAAGSIAASLGMPEKGNLLGKLMATAAKEGRVRLLKVGSQKLYRSLPKPE